MQKSSLTALQAITCAIRSLIITSTYLQLLEKWGMKVPTTQFGAK